MDKRLYFVAEEARRRILSECSPRNISYWQQQTVETLLIVNTAYSILYNMGFFIVYDTEKKHYVMMERVDQ